MLVVDIFFSSRRLHTRYWRDWSSDVCSSDLEDKKVVLIDDVLYTGRTIRAALDALLDFGRPAKVELCVLIDRRFSRQLPIQPDYTGKVIDALISQKVKVLWKEKDPATEVIITE